MLVFEITTDAFVVFIQGMLVVDIDSAQLAIAPMHPFIEFKGVFVGGIAAVGADLVSVKAVAGNVESAPADLTDRPVEIAVNSSFASLMLMHGVAAEARSAFGCVLFGEFQRADAAGLLVLSIVERGIGK